MFKKIHPAGCLQVSLLMGLLVLSCSQQSITINLSTKSQPLPSYAGPVNDMAGVISETDRAAISSAAEALERTTGAQMAVLAVKNIDAYGSSSMDDFSLSVAESWKLGQAGKDNGILLALSVEDRKVKIEVGYGLEGTIPDSMAGRILDEAVLPAFKNGDFSGGLSRGAAVIANTISRSAGGGDLSDVSVPDVSVAESKPAKSPSPSLIFFMIIFFGIILFMIIMTITQRGKGSGSGTGLPPGSRSNFPGSSSGGSSHSGGGGHFGGGGSGRSF